MPRSLRFSRSIADATTKTGEQRITHHKHEGTGVTRTCSLVQQTQQNRGTVFPRGRHSDRPRVFPAKMTFSRRKHTENVIFAGQTRLVGHCLPSGKRGTLSCCEKRLTNALPRYSAVRFWYREIFGVAALCAMNTAPNCRWQLVIRWWPEMGVSTYQRSASKSCPAIESNHARCVVSSAAEHNKLRQTAPRTIASLVPTRRKTKKKGSCTFLSENTA